MADANILESIDGLIDQKKYDEAAAMLAGTEGQASADVLRIKLAIRQETIEPGTAMQRLIAIMRSDPKTPRAQDVYREVSSLAYRSASSTMAHSHPPPTKPRG